MKLVTGAVATCVLLMSCGLLKSRPKIKADHSRSMTTTELAVGYDTVYACVLSALRSEGFQITTADKNRGQVSAIKKNIADASFLDKFWRRTYPDANTIQVLFRLHVQNPVQTQVTLTIHPEDTTAVNAVNGKEHTDNAPPPVDNAELYQAWFDKVRHEVLQRRGIIAIEPPEQGGEAEAFPSTDGVQ